MGRAPCCTKIGLRRGPWSIKEDTTLTNYIQQHGEGLWRSLPKNAGLLRCGKSCRLRWMNYLRPGIKRGNISQDEEDLIVRLHGLLGNRWSLIAGRLPGRTDNEIKNYWNTHLIKKLKTPIPKSNDKDTTTKNPTPKIPKPNKSTPTPNAASKKKKQKKVNDDTTKAAEEQKVYLPKAIRVSNVFSSSSSYDSLASGTSSSEGGVTAEIGSYVPVMWPEIGEDDLVGFVMPDNDQSDGDVNMWERVYDEFFQLL